MKKITITVDENQLPLLLAAIESFEIKNPSPIDTYNKIVLMEILNRGILDMMIQSRAGLIMKYYSSY